jgi:hypothetical protein
MVSRLELSDLTVKQNAQKSLVDYSCKITVSKLHVWTDISKPDRDEIASRFLFEGFKENKTKQNKKLLRKLSDLASLNESN